MSNSSEHLNADFVCAEIRVTIKRLREEIAGRFMTLKRFPSSVTSLQASIFEKLGETAVGSECFRLMDLFRQRSDILDRVPEIVATADSDAFEEYQRLWIEADTTRRRPRKSSSSPRPLEELAQSILRKIGAAGPIPTATLPLFFELGEIGRVALSVTYRRDNTIDFKWVFFERENVPGIRGHNGLCAIAPACEPERLDRPVMEIVSTEALLRLEMLRFAVENPEPEKWGLG